MSKRGVRGEIDGLYWLPKEIAEMPRVEAPGPRRDEGVDEHPRPRNNAGTGVSTPESEFSCPRSGTSSLPPYGPISARTFGNQYILNIEAFFLLPLAMQLTAAPVFSMLASARSAFSSPITHNF